MPHLPNPRIENPDVIVIGTGAAGGVVMKELATQGLKVVALEMGPWLKTRDYVLIARISGASNFRIMSAAVSQ